MSAEFVTGTRSSSMEFDHGTTEGPTCEANTDAIVVFYEPD